MKVVFFGSPEAALPSLRKLLEAGHEVRLIITQPDKPSGRGRTLTPSPVKRFALEKGLPVYQPVRIRKDEQALDRIREAQPDINVVVAFGQIIPDSIIYLPRFRAINLHFSLLPKYRGAAPVQWAILNGESKTGLTIFELNDKMDEGDILSQEDVEITPGIKAFELEALLAQKGAALLVRTLSAIDRLPHIQQDHSQATYAPRLEKNNGRFDWIKDAGLIDRQVRAFSPWPGAFTFFKGRRILIHQGKASPGTKLGRAHGEILSVSKTGLEVCCGGGNVYLIERLQQENRKEMDAYSFSLGMKLREGDILG